MKPAVAPFTWKIPTASTASCSAYREATPRASPHAHRAGEFAHGGWTEVDESPVLDVACPAGTVVLFSANLLHGARSNLSARTSYRKVRRYSPGDLNLVNLERFPRGIYRDRHILRRP